MTSLFDLPFEEPPDEPPAPTGPRVLTVTELTASVRAVLESALGTVAVEGEISNCKLYNGILYFTLKDAGAQLRVVMFRTAVRALKFRAEDGQHVVARGRVSVYEARGEYQLLCDALEPVGLGALQAAYEQLKRKLQSEGLFDAARKRALPALPRKIGIVTSLEGAAIRDIITVLRKRHPNLHLIVRAARVQGEGAAADLARGLTLMARVPGVDVVIVGRGGGSIEDLWAFNEEVVARAIAACPIPVISAVGHETDFTIADFVADHRAPTPSAAAEMVVARKDEFCARIDRHADRLHAALRARLVRLRQRLHTLEQRPPFANWPARLSLRARHLGETTHALRYAASAALGRRARALEVAEKRLESHDPRRRLGGVRAALSRLRARLDASAARHAGERRQRLGAAAARLEALSPLAVLGRGYAVCWDAAGTRIIRDAGTVAPGDRLRVTLARGEVEADVTATYTGSANRSVDGSKTAE